MSKFQLKVWFLLCRCYASWSGPEKEQIHGQLPEKVHFKNCCQQSNELWNVYIIALQTVCWFCFFISVFHSHYLIVLVHVHFGHRLDFSKNPLKADGMTVSRHMISVLFWLFWFFKKCPDWRFGLILVRGLSGVQFSLFPFVNHKYDYRPTSGDMKSTYQWIIKITIFEKHKE